MDAEQPSFSLKEIEREAEELGKDHTAFVRAYDTLRARVQDSLDAGPRVPDLHRWSGTSACMGALELSINAIRRAHDEYATLIQKVKTGELINTDPPEKPTRPVLSIMDGGQKT